MTMCAAPETECGTRSGRPVRVLHVLGGMDRGGVETWLMHVLRHIDRDRIEMDFLVHTDRRCAYDDEIDALGSHIYFCPNPWNPLQYAWNFRRVVRQHGPYDVVHSHVHHFSGFVLALANSLGIRRRIAHSHNDTRVVDAAGSRVRRGYLSACRRAIHAYATLKLGASAPAAESLYNSAWKNDSATRILYYGIDLKPFEQPVTSAEVRAEFELSPEDFVVGHIGRFVEQKNHAFLLQVFHEVLKKNPEAKLLLLGKGPLESSIRARARQMGIDRAIRFAGVRSDVPRIMLGAMDVFVLPSRYEGLGLVALEAQAAGIPTVLSTDVPEEADAGCGLVSFLPLALGPKSWADAVLRVSDASKSNRALPERLRVSPFNVENGVKELCECYKPC